jgi:hypothetical protein
MAVTVSVLGSGSRGNTLLSRLDNTHLIDAGLSQKSQSG